MSHSTRTVALTYQDHIPPEHQHRTKLYNGIVILSQQQKLESTWIYNTQNCSVTMHSKWENASFPCYNVLLPLNMGWGHWNGHEHEKPVKSVKVVIRQNLSVNSLREKASYKAFAFGKCMSLSHLDRCKSYHKHCVLYTVHVGDNHTKFELIRVKTLGEIHFLVLCCWHQCVCVFACEHACMCVCVQYFITAMFMITLLHCTLIQNGFQE